jgi:hypothetical protein
MIQCRLLHVSGPRLRAGEYHSRRSYELDSTWVALACPLIIGPRDGLAFRGGETLGGDPAHWCVCADVRLARAAQRRVRPPLRRVEAMVRNYQVE